jgi:hypothetical protein
MIILRTLSAFHDRSRLEPAHCSPLTFFLLSRLAPCIDIMLPGRDRMFDAPRGVDPFKTKRNSMMTAKQRFFPSNTFARILFSLGLLALPLGMPFHLRADVIDASLKVRFNFDAAPVADAIADTSPAAGHPGANNSAQWAATEGGRNGVMNFDGTIPAQITVPAAADLNSNVGAITFWMESSLVTANPNAYAIIFDRRSQGGDVIYQEPAGHLANQAQQASGGGANSQTTTASLTDGKWHHIAYVYDQGPSGSLSFYVDGVLDVSGPNSLSWSWPPAQEIEIGASHDSFWSGYTGFLDDFRIYNRALTASEVANIAGLSATPQIVISASGQPQDQTVAVKDTPSFTVKATLLNGDPAQLHYQWQKDQVNIPNATSSTYSFPAAATDSGAKFRVQITAPGAATVTSAEATLMVVPESTLIYSFDAEPVGDVIVDSTPDSIKHDGLNVGATWQASEAGRNGVMNFDGTLPSQITIAPASELDSSRGTIAFWMKSDLVTPDPNPYAILFDRRETPGSGGDVIYQGPDGHLANQAEAVDRTGANAQSTTGNLTDGQWHHFAYLYDQSAGGSVSFYVDGVLNTTKVNARAWAWNPDQEIELGKSHDSFWSGFTGFLDEFRIYNRVLSASEIAQLAGLGPQPQIVISRQPESLTTGVNDTPTFSVTAIIVNGDAANLHYQWQKEGTDIPGATSANYTFKVSAADDGKKFRCQISYSGAPGVTSAEATLTVLPEFVVHFPFDQEPQADVVVDTSPGGNNGLNVGAAWVANQDGRAGVMSFDGVLGSQITIAAASNLNSSRGTIAFWMQSSATSLTPNPYAMLFDRRAMPADGVPVIGGDVIFQLPDGHVSDQAEVAGRARANAFSTTVNPTDGKWHHLAYLYDQTAKGFVAFYVDGVLDGINTNSLSWYWVPEETIELGKSHDAFWSGYTGFLDDLRIYNRVLSASELSTLAGVVSAPTLHLSLVGRTATLTWSETGFVLQENSDLGNPNGWTNVANGNTSPVTITIGQSGAKFYRLKKS